MEHFIYFVSYNFRTVDGQIGFGNGEADLKLPLESQEQFKELEAKFTKGINEQNIITVTNVIIINFQLIKNYKDLEK